MVLRGRSHTTPGCLLKSQIPVRTWAEWDDVVPSFVEIDLVGHEGGNNRGEFCFILTVTNISTGWTVNRPVHSKAQKHVFTALMHVMEVFPFPIIGIDSDSGSEFIIRNCCASANSSRLRSPVPGYGTRTRKIVRMWSRKTGHGSANRSATSTMTAPKSWNCSTSIGSETRSSRTSCCRSRSWFPKPATGLRSPRSLTGRQRRISGQWHILR